MQAIFNLFMGSGTTTATAHKSGTHFNQALPINLVKDSELFLKNNSVWFAHSPENFGKIQTDTSQQEYVVYPAMGYSDGLYLSQNQERCISTGNIKALYTPMRASGSAGRLSLPNKCAPENNSMWLTDKQTGCAVAIIKWPKSSNHVHEYAMVHLQPNSWDDNPENKKQLEAMWKKNDGQGISSFQDAHLKQDLLTIFSGISESGIKPEGYVLSFSSFDDQHEGLETQVVGVVKENEFVFYEQKTEAGVDVPASCKELFFTSWDSFGKELRRC